VKIAYVVTRADSVGGASIHVRDLARAMLERGHEAVVLVGGTGPVTEQLARAGVPYHSLRFLKRPISPVTDFRALQELTVRLRELQPDLVSTHTAKAGWIGRAACARLSLPALYTPHGWSIADRISRAHSAVFQLAERAASRWASAIICVCEYERQLALEHRVAAPGRLHVVHNGVRDVSLELRADPARHPVRIISVARFASPKDHRTLLHALGTLRSLPWELDLIGDGPRQAEIAMFADSLDLAGRVRFLGYQPEPATSLAQAQIFALSSRSEGFPRSVLEAMRAGLPVIASDVGGVGEAVANEVSGLLVPRRSPESLAAAIAKLIENAPLRERLGKAGRQTYERRFGLERLIEATAGVYDTILCRSPAGRRVI